MAGEPEIEFSDAEVEMEEDGNYTLIFSMIMKPPEEK